MSFTNTDVQANKLFKMPTRHCRHAAGITYNIQTSHLPYPFSNCERQALLDNKPGPHAVHSQFLQKHFNC
jgi:hypothetical protein